jgi:hypothetical protein
VDVPRVERREEESEGQESAERECAGTRRRFDGEDWSKNLKIGETSATTETNSRSKNENTTIFLLHLFLYA